MDWSTIWASVWVFLNSPVGISAVVGLFIWLLNHLYASKPTWSKYEGTIISGIKFAEKEIPDDVTNKGLARFNVALKYILKVYEEMEGKRASKKTENSLKEGIHIVHNSLDKDSTL